MKICVTSVGKSLDSLVDERFGRCSFFAIVDAESLTFEVLSNEGALGSGGAGIQAAQSVVNSGAGVVITGNVGPNAFQVLSSAGVDVFIGAKGTVKEVVEDFKSGVLKRLESASVESHFGMKAVGKGFGDGDSK